MGAIALSGVAAGALVVASAVAPRVADPPATVVAAAATKAEGAAPLAAEPARPPSDASAPTAEGREVGEAGTDLAAGMTEPVALAAIAPGAAPGGAAALPATRPAPGDESRGVGEAGEASVKRRPTVYDAPDSELLAPLRGSPVTGCKLNLGGTSLSLRVDFQSGGRAAFKPEQIHAQSQPRREVAAYRVDRMLGIGHVPPAAAIIVSMPELIASIPPALRGAVGERIRNEALPKKGQLRGAASWWIPEIKVPSIGKYPIDSTDGIVTWRRYLTIGAAPTPEITSFVSQISDMVLFDFLIDNSDRWSGGNARTSPDGKILYFMDNTLAFTRNKQAHSRTSTYLKRVKLFSKQLVENVRRFSREDLVAALSSADDAALAPLLSEEEIDAVMARRDLAVAYIDELILEHGADAVLVFP